MKGDESMSEYVLQMKLITKELFDVGHPHTDKMQVTTILDSLSSSWDHIVT